MEGRLRALEANLRWVCQSLLLIPLLCAFRRLSNFTTGVLPDPSCQWRGLAASWQSRMTDAVW